jgi:hypothetical protein
MLRIQVTVMDLTVLPLRRQRRPTSHLEPRAAETVTCLSASLAASSLVHVEQCRPAYAMGDEINTVRVGFCGRREADTSEHVPCHDR